MVQPPTDQALSSAPELDDTDLQATLLTGVAMGQPGLSVAVGRGDEVVWVGA